MISILTPTYNRGYIISKAYQSLKSQTDKDFEWIIIDDGSVDDTEKIVKEFIKEKALNIKYYKKSNGGKHTALNYGLKYVKGSSIIILDSDDILTNDAVEKTKKYWKKYDKQKNISAISFIKITPDGKKIGKEMENNEFISNYIDYRCNKNVYGDMAEVYKTEILKKYPFPVFKDEKFLSEAIVWNKISFDYDMVFVNEAIYIAEYLDDGLTKNSLNMRINSPIGASENANVFLNSRFKLWIRIKNAILYDGFSLIAKKQEMIKKSNNKFLTILFFPLGFVFYLFLIYTKNRSKK